MLPWSDLCQSKFALRWTGELRMLTSRTQFLRIQTIPSGSRTTPLWRNFAVESIARAEDWARYVVLADVTAYYEYIDISILTSELRALGAGR